MKEERLIKIDRILTKDLMSDFDKKYDNYKIIIDSKGFEEVKFIKEKKYTNVYGTIILDMGDFFEQ